MEEAVHEVRVDIVNLLPIDPESCIGKLHSYYVFLKKLTTKNPQRVFEIMDGSFNSIFARMQYDLADCVRIRNFSNGAGKCFAGRICEVFSSTEDLIALQQVSSLLLGFRLSRMYKGKDNNKGFVPGKVSSHTDETTTDDGKQVKRKNNLEGGGKRL